MDLRIATRRTAGTELRLEIEPACTLATVHEYRIEVGSRSVMVREAGDLAGAPVLYLHGTPGCRLDVAFGDEIAADLGVRLISFDRPGYGQSDGAPFGLRRIAEDVMAVADSCGLARLATLGWSGGGPYALAAAAVMGDRVTSVGVAVMGDRVTSVGVAAGPGPFQQVPGALDRLGDDEKLALSYLPDQPVRAAEQFCVGSEVMIAFRDDEQALMSGLDALFADVDADVLSKPEMRHHLFVMMSEALRQGFLGVGWDNVAWVGEWDVDLGAVRCPVALWYGGSDQMIPLAHGEWLRYHLHEAELTVYGGEGHLIPMRHWREMLRKLVPGVSP